MSKLSSKDKKVAQYRNFRIIFRENGQIRSVHSTPITGTESYWRYNDHTKFMVGGAINAKSEDDAIKKLWIKCQSIPVPEPGKRIERVG